MKRFCMLTLAVALFVLWVAPASAQERVEETVTTIDSTGSESTVKVVRIRESENITPYRHVIEVDPLKFFILANLSYVNSLTDVVAVGGELTYTWGFIDELVSGPGFHVMGRVYPGARGLHGFYLGAELALNSWVMGDGYYDENTGNWVEEERRQTTIFGGPMVGWQWFFGSNFSMGLSLGGNAVFTSSRGEYDPAILLGEDVGFMPDLSFTIGAAFE